MRWRTIGTHPRTRREAGVLSPAAMPCGTVTDEAASSAVLDRYVTDAGHARGREHGRHARRPGSGDGAGTHVTAPGCYFLGLGTARGWTLGGPANTRSALISW